MTFYHEIMMNSDAFIICAVVLAIVGILPFLLFLKNSEKSWQFIFKEQKYDALYGIMGIFALLDDIVSKNKNKVELRELPGKVAVITGGTRGIGKEVVKILLKCGINVVIGCRNTKAGEEILNEFKSEGISVENCTVLKLDVSSLASVKEFSDQVRSRFPKINFLINNAGIMFGPYKESVDGYELQFATNYLGHFLLTHLLLDNIKAAGKDNDRSRIVNVSSCAHTTGEINYDDINNKSNFITAAAYSQSKLAQILFTKQLDSDFKKNNFNVECYAVHPGIVDTELFDTTLTKKLFPWLLKFLFKTPTEGAFSIIYACISESLYNKGGSYISNCEITPSKDITFFPENQQKLFDYTNKILRIKEFGKVE